jgi:hypothetical protein
VIPAYAMGADVTAAGILQLINCACTCIFAKTSTQRRTDDTEQILRFHETVFERSRLRRRFQILMHNDRRIWSQLTGAHQCCFLVRQALKSYNRNGTRKAYWSTLIDPSSMNPATRENGNAHMHACTHRPGDEAQCWFLQSFCPHPDHS